MYFCRCQRDKPIGIYPVNGRPHLSSFRMTPRSIVSASSTVSTSWNTRAPNRTSYTVDIVIPCYLEQDVLPITVPAIQNYLRGLAQQGNYKLASCRLILVDDGSNDSTWDAIRKFNSVHPEIAGIKLSRNCGHQSALLAGMAHASADVVISMDADLQDDIHAIGKMLLAYEAGSDLVLGVRSDRTSDTVKKRGTAGAYYKILSLLGVNIVENHADFRLMSKRALAALLLHNEVNLFLRGIIPTLGFKTSIVPYARQSRAAGKTEYLRKMARLALDGVTSVGIAIFLASMSIGLYYFGERIFAPESVVPGWTSTVLPVLFLGGLQLLSIGVLGEYIGKIYLEVKHRPRFIVEETTFPS
jgi:glycosyltransferase involved in cell wall biosynthesis